MDLNLQVREDHENAPIFSVKWFVPVGKTESCFLFRCLSVELRERSREETGGCVRANEEQPSPGGDIV